MPYYLPPSTLPKTCFRYFVNSTGKRYTQESEISVEFADTLCLHAKISQGFSDRQTGVYHRTLLYLYLPFPPPLLVSELVGGWRFFLQLEHLAFYLIELSLTEYEALRFRPSLLCASAVYVARCTLNKLPAWTSLLGKHAQYEEYQMRHYFFPNHPCFWNLK